LTRAILCFALAALACSVCLPTNARAPAPVVLDGSVINSTTGAPMADVRLRLSATGDEPVYARSDKNGQFRFDDLKPGRFELEADRPGFMPVNNSSPFPQPIPVDLTSRQALGSITIRMVAYGVVSGTVTDPDGVPMVRTPVEVLMDSPAGHTANAQQIRVLTSFTDDRGEFRAARLAPATYYVTAVKSTWANGWQDNWRTTWFPHALDVASSRALTIAAGDQVRADIRVVRQNGVRVAGRLIAPSAAESALKTKLVLEPQVSSSTDSGVPHATVTGDRFEFASVLPGQYVLTAITSAANADPYAAAEKAIYGVRRRLDVGAGGIAELNIDLQPLPPISGRVVFAEACKPRPLHVDIGGFTPLASSGADAVTASDGSFTLAGLKPARLSLSVRELEGVFGDATLISARLGERELSLAQGFDYPLAADAPLTLTVGCGASGRAK